MCSLLVNNKLQQLLRIEFFTFIVSHKLFTMLAILNYLAKLSNMFQILRNQSNYQ